MYTQKNEEYLDFLTYVLIHAACSDNEIGDDEMAMIKEKASAQGFKETLAYYRSHSASQRLSYMTKMKDKWLHTDDSKIAMVQKVQEITGVDLVLHPEEKEAYQELKKLLL